MVWTGLAWAGSVVAIVEEIKADATNVGFMDYLGTGRTIALGKNGRLVLGYLNSCLREVIIGGNVTVGMEKSVVKGGKVRRERVECDGGRLLLTAEQASKSAVVVFRKGILSKGGSLLQPSLRIYSLQPLIQVKSLPSIVTVERLDRSRSTITVKLRNGVADFVTKSLSLERGGLYRVTGNGASRIVSSVSVYNELVHRRPDLIDRLYEPFALDTRGEQGRDGPTHLPITPCRYADGKLRTFYHSDYFRSAVRHDDVPAFTDDEITLLDLYEEIADSPELCFDMQFEPGDIQLLSNHTILHSRKAYDDEPSPDHKRHLLRLWLSL